MPDALTSADFPTELGMARIGESVFSTGSDDFDPEERRFVEATGWVTDAEKSPDPAMEADAAAG